MTDLGEITARVREKANTLADIPGNVIIIDFADEGLIRFDGGSVPPVVDNNDSVADCRIRVSLDDFKHIAAGRQSAQMAYLTGKVKIEGDFGLAMQLGELIGR